MVFDDMGKVLCPECLKERKPIPSKVFCAGLCRRHYDELRHRERDEWDGRPVLKARDFLVWPLKYQPYKQQLDWLDMYERHPWLLLLAPCDHGKTITVVSYAAYKVAQDPDIRIVLCSSVERVAKLLLGAVKWHLEKNVDYIRYFTKMHGFPPRPDRGYWTKEAVTVNRYSGDDAIKDPTVAALSKGGELENRRIDLFLGDDMITMKGAHSEVQRETDLNWFLDVVMTRGEEDCEVKVEGTPEHPDDLYETLATGETDTGDKFSEFFHIVRVRALAPIGESHYYTDADRVVNETEYKSGELKALCEEMMSKKELLRRSRLRHSAFMKKYQCRHSASEERIYPAGRLSACKDPDMKLPASYDQYDRDYRMTLMGIDIATGVGMSFFAMVLMGIDMDFRHVLLNVFRERLRFAQQLGKIMDWYRKYMPSFVGVESNGQQQAIIDAYKNVRVVQGVDVTGIELIPFEAVFTSKALELSATSSLSTMVDNGNFILPDGDREAQIAITPLFDEMKHYPGSRQKDCLKALHIAEALYAAKVGPGNTVGTVPGLPTIRGSYKRRVRGRHQTRWRTRRGAKEPRKVDVIGLPRGGGVKLSLIDEIRRRSR